MAALNAEELADLQNVCLALDIGYSDEVHAQLDGGVNIADVLGSDHREVELLLIIEFGEIQRLVRLQLAVEFHLADDHFSLMLLRELLFSS